MDNQQVISDVLIPDAAARTLKPDPGKIMTIHYHVPDTAKAYAEDQAGWDAYVAEYRANSRILSTTNVCLPLSTP